MMTLIEDVRSALRQMCRAFGLTGTAATVVPVVVLGVLLNVAALDVVQSARSCQMGKRTTLAQVAKTELKLMRTTVTSTLRSISGGQRALCSAEQWMQERGIDVRGKSNSCGAQSTDSVA
jgi:hypothetical protein